MGFKIGELFSQLSLVRGRCDYIKMVREIQDCWLQRWEQGGPLAKEAGNGKECPARHAALPVS